MKWIVRPAKSLHGSISVPGDKSISHRAVMLGSPEITGLLESEDVKATREVSSGRSGYCGNSGTTMRLMMGILASSPGTVTLDGDESLMRRPMERVAKPLREMGADIRTTNGRPPVTITGAKLEGREITIDVASAQVKSALLLAGLNADGITKVRMPAASRDHTERMLEYFGVNVTVEDGGRIVSILGGQKLEPKPVDVPGDISSAAFVIAAALLCKDSKVTIRNLGFNPLRTGITDVLGLKAGTTRIVSNEPRVDLTVSSSPVGPLTIGGDDIPRLIDEIPILALVAALADGAIITGAKELRVKETDRIDAIVGEFNSIGLVATPTDDGIIILGRQVIRGGTINSRGDHRIAMMGAVAGLASADGVIVENVECVETSFPGFAELFRSIGADIRLARLHA